MSVQPRVSCALEASASLEECCRSCKEREELKSTIVYNSKKLKVGRESRDNELPCLVCSTTFLSSPPPPRCRARRESATGGQGSSEGETARASDNRGQRGHNRNLIVSTRGKDRQLLRQYGWHILAFYTWLLSLTSSFSCEEPCGLSFTAVTKQRYVSTVSKRPLSEKTLLSSETLDSLWSLCTEGTHYSTECLHKFRFRLSVRCNIPPRLCR